MMFAPWWRCRTNLQRNVQDATFQEENNFCATERTNADELRVRIFPSFSKISWLSSQYLSDGWSGCFLFGIAKVKILNDSFRFVWKNCILCIKRPLNLATFCVRTKHYRANGINTFCWCNREIPVHEGILENKNRSSDVQTRSEKWSSAERVGKCEMKSSRDERRSAIILFTFEVIFKHMWMKKLDAS